MKHLLTVTAVMIFSLLGLLNTTTAQGKIGYISTEELIGSMPEADQQARL